MIYYNYSMVKKLKKDNSSTFGVETPDEIYDKEIRQRRAEREHREDIEAAFGTGY